MDKIVLGFSGGVDSSVAAALLIEAGYDVRGLFLITSGAESLSEVRSAAERIGFPLEIKDERARLQEYVCRPFAESYLRGETPNPCILCNPAVKLKALCCYADAIGAEKIATGHYVRTEEGGLYRGKAANDQSYMLCRISREQARRFTAPLGGLEKTEVRAIAERLDIPAAKKPDSMEICFIPDGDRAAWMARRGLPPSPGKLIYNGAVVGCHNGTHNYTLGQRRGLGFSAGRRVYVSEIRPEQNEVVLSDGDGLFLTTLRAGSFNWLIDRPAAPFRCEARIRHSKTLCPATATPDGNGVLVEFDSPVRAPTRGQTAALYIDDRLLGGGFIV